MTILENITKHHHAPGNTNLELKRKISTRHVQVTANNEQAFQASVNYLMESKMLDYIIACEEIAPTTGHKHYHIYAHFDNTRSLKLERFKGAHVEICRGSAVQNIQYIKKDGKIIFEEGVPPSSASLTITELKNIHHAEDLPDWKQYKVWQSIQIQKELDIEDWHKDVKVYYIQGPSGIGKSLKAKQIILENKEKYGTKFSLAKFENGFWSGVNSEGKVLIYDDFRDSHMPASEFINLIDYNRHQMNIKGGSVINNYELIICTSVIPIKQLYKNLPDEPKKQWLRRCDVISLGSIEETEDISFESSEYD